METKGLSLFHIEDHYLALLETEELTDGDERLQILNEIAETNDAALRKRDDTARFLLFAGDRIDEVRKEIKRLQDLEASWTGKLDRLFKYVASVIERFAPEPRKKGEAKKLEGRLSVLSIRKNPDSTEVYDSSKVPMEYKGVTIELTGKDYVALEARLKEWDMEAYNLLHSGAISAKPQKSLIKKALDAGVDVPGCDRKFGEMRLVVK